MELEQIRTIIEQRREQWERALKHAEATHAEFMVIITFDASATAARVILQDIETAYKAQRGNDGTRK